MQKHDLVQGSPEWLAYRMNHHNASDAPVMLGLSPYKSRDALLLELNTGLAAEVSDETKRVFNDGHRFEALARPLAEQIIGEDLYPVVGSEGKLSASFDGLTMLEDVAFEHKSLNNELRAVMVEGITGADLPLHYQVQMEQQCMIAGCERVLFMASKWDADGGLVEERHCWYEPNPELRARILAGWAQFEQDLCEFVPPAAEAPKATGRAPETLPALRIEVTGQVTASNLDAFKASALTVIRGINRDLKTDQDFADAERTVKWCGDVEERLAAAKQHALSQTESIDALFRAIDDISAETRRVRLDLDKLVKAKKESIRMEIVAEGQQALRDHLATLVQRLGHNYLPTIAADFAGAIKGKKTVQGLREAVNQTLADAKIQASSIADRIQINLGTLRELAADFKFLFNDTAAIVLKAPEDLTALVKSRIADHKAEEAERLAREQAKLQAEQDRKNEAERLAKQRQANEFAARVAGRFAEFDRLLTFTEQTASATINAALLLASSNAPSVDTFGDRLEEAMAKHALVLEHLQAALPGALRREEAEKTAQLAAEAEAEAKAAAARAAIVPVAQPVAQVREPEQILTMTLRDINTAFGGVLTMSGEGMALLGFNALPVKGPAKVYPAADFDRICNAIADHVHTVRARRALASLEKAA